LGSTRRDVKALIYLLALDRLEVQADEAIAFEDSPNGILAAKRAGIFCVAIPNPLTKELPLHLADRRLSSLEEFHLDDV
jgi:beta-phosphoglucomutase-like phosphatase (HAD superfamily)